MANEHKELGKIQDARFGCGGYQDAQIGIAFTLGGESWQVSDFWGAWNRTGNEAVLGQAVMRLGTLLAACKARDVTALVGKPVEVTFHGGVLLSWRPLTEVM